MSEAPMDYMALPEDLEPIQNLRSQVALTVTIGKGPILLSRAAYEALGSPQRSEILLGQSSRMVAFRPVDRGGFAVTRFEGTGRIGGLSMAKRLGLPATAPGQPHKFPARLVDGALLIGPLPEGES